MVDVQCFPRIVLALQHFAIRSFVPNLVRGPDPAEVWFILMAAEVVEDNSRLLRINVACGFDGSWKAFQGEKEAPSNDGYLE